MRNAMAKRILGGIAWASTILLSQLAWGQQGSLHATSAPNPSATPVASGWPQPQPALSSKEYMRLMAEADEARLASATTVRPLPQAPDARLESQHGVPLPSPAPLVPVPVPPVVPQVRENNPHPFVDASSVASMTPRFSVAVEHVWLRRGGDEGTSWSGGGSLGGLGEDRSAAYRLGWYSNPMERYEFAFLGSMVWSRSGEYPGPVSSLLQLAPEEPNWYDSFDDSTRHAQSHTARLRSYEWNKRWITDDLGNYFVGLHGIDYREAYQLQSQDPDANGTLGLSTRNWLVGMQGGLELWRPISQRLAIGGQGLGGLYGNFADGTWYVEAQNEGTFRHANEKFQLAASLGLDAKVRYQFTSRIQAFGGYRWWVLAGLGTVDDQTLGPLASDTPFVLSTDAGFLLQGATCGLEFVF